MMFGKPRGPARSVEQGLAPAHATCGRDHLGPTRVDAALERRDVDGRRDGQVLGRSERRLRRPIHERVQQGAAGSLLPLDARHVGVQPGQLQLQPQGVLQAAMSRPLVEAGQLQDARGEPDVLEMQVQLLIGARSSSRRSAAPGRRLPAGARVRRPARSPRPLPPPARGLRAIPTRERSVARPPSECSPGRARRDERGERPTARTWPPDPAIESPPGCAPRRPGHAPGSPPHRGFRSSATRRIVSRRALLASSASSDGATGPWVPAGGGAGPSARSAWAAARNASSDVRKKMDVDA